MTEKASDPSMPAEAEPAQESADAGTSGDLDAQTDAEDLMAAAAAAAAAVASEESESGEPDAVDELTQWKDRALRSQAELENFRKRMARDKSEAIQYANSALLETLLPIIDNFEMGLHAARAESEGSMLYQGLSMVQKQLQDFLSEQGLEPVAAEGQAFDPRLHEAVDQRPSEEVPEGHVIAEVRRGYRLRDRLLRAANVVVSAGPGEAGIDDAQAGDSAPEEGAAADR